MLPTPDTFDMGDQQRVTPLPVDVALWEAIGGALMLLADPASWEQVGSKTPEETAQFFLTYLLNWYDSTTTI